MGIVTIEKKEYKVQSNEFEKIYKEEYCSLEMYNDVGFYERISGLISDISEELNINTVLYINPTHGGFLPIINSNKIKNNYVHPIIPSFLSYSNISDNLINLDHNQRKHDIKNIALLNTTEIVEKSLNPYILYIDNINDLTLAKTIHDLLKLKNNTHIIICNENRYFDELMRENSLQNQTIHKFKLWDSKLCVYLADKYLNNFMSSFKYYIEDNTEPVSILNYDNLINLCIMVKNGGPQFEQMLLENYSLIDRWTILDTGSSDETIDIINKVLVGKKKGRLYQEPFINFRDSRNRLLELAGDTCKYTLMLDDTYIIRGNLRKFLNETRGDQFSDSFTLYIKSDDTEYGSNRILKTNRKLKYLYKIHEVVQSENNKNVVIPIDDAHIFDGRFDYMEKRTMERKELDLTLLFDELREDPDNPRTYYYLAQTYNILEKYQEAFEWFIKRVNHKNEGFIQEKVDAAFEASRIANFKLNKSWDVCEQLYNNAYNLDKSRPESLYFIGIHYYLENNFLKSYEYFKRAFEIGYPLHCQYSLKPTLSYHFLPKFLAKVCYDENIQDYKLGEAASFLFLQKNPQSTDSYEEMLSWYNIYRKLNLLSTVDQAQLVNEKFYNNKYDKPLLVFVADGGFNTWSGSSINKSGVGGSETYIIEMSRYIQKSNKFQVVVFCNCEAEEFFEDVYYKHLTSYAAFIQSNKIHTSIISRFSEYIPLTYKGNVENIYLVLHDLGPSGIVIPIDKRLKQIFCLTEWHVEHFTQTFPMLKNITSPFYYGIDTNKFVNIKNIEKVRHKFIYSSFPNRGLLQLLQMWPSIYSKYPSASLHIYSDVNGKWVNEVVPEQMREIRILLENYKSKQFGLNINYHGWVDKETLADAWHSADIWFYPCIFKETFCLTALEAAMSKTLAVTNNLAALQNTVGDRGVVIEGDASSKEWHDKALSAIFYYMDENNVDKKMELIERNYLWASNLTWEGQANKLLNWYIDPYGEVKSNSEKIDHESRNINRKIEINLNKMRNQYIKDIITKAKNIIIESLVPIIKGFNEPLEGCYFSKHLSNEISDYAIDRATNLCRILLEKQPKNILEIGFNAGFSTLLMLLTNSEIKITCVDICEHTYTLPSFNWISKNFPNRIQFIQGNSIDVLPLLINENKKYDLIHIDGGHSTNVFFHDVQNSIKLSNKNTILVVDDYDFCYIKLIWNLFVDYYKLKKYNEIKEQSIYIV